jgi:hypothetical protein
MNIQLISGSFDKAEAISIVSQMIRVKINFHEQKIADSSNEEDIKFRESKIKKLQNDLYELKQKIGLGAKNVRIDAQLNIE